MESKLNFGGKMKILIIVAVIGLLAVASFVVANIVSDDGAVEEITLSCGGGCSVGNECSNPTCGIKNGKSCGCRG